jgi:hypothetical protein
MILTPKEKAKELVNRFLGLEYVLFQHDGEPFTFPQGRINLYSAKQCALIAVDELIHYLEIVLGVDKEDFEYWQEVKKEIENL